MPGLLLERLLGAELLDVQLLAQNDRLNDLTGHGGLFNVGLSDGRLAVALAYQEDLVERQLLTGLGLSALHKVNQNDVVLADCPLGPGLLDDCVHA